MANNPNATDNLRILKKGETANPKGRPKKIINLISEIPKEEQLKVYARLWEVLRCSSIEEAQRMVVNQGPEEYGVIFEMAVDALTGPNGWNVLKDILERLFGKPKVVTDNVVEQREPGLLIQFAPTPQPGNE